MYWLAVLVLEMLELNINLILSFVLGPCWH